MSRVKISACQFSLRKYGSFSQFTQHVKSYMEQVPFDSDYVAFPELITAGLSASIPQHDNDIEDNFAEISMYTPQYIALFSDLAKKRQQVILSGSHLENRKGKIFNVAYVFKKDGTYVEHCKTHVIPDEKVYHTNEGDSFAVYDIGPAKIGLAICYEAEIPEISRVLSILGAEIIFCPSYTSSEHGFWRVRYCSHARAVENQVYYVHIPIIGDPGYPVVCGYGRAAIISPCDFPWNSDGIVAEGQNDKEMVVTGAVDLDLLYQNRQQGSAPTYNDRNRRAELYKQYLPYKN